MLTKLEAPLRAQVDDAVAAGDLSADDAKSFAEWIPLILTIAQIVLDWIKSRRNPAPPPVPTA